MCVRVCVCVCVMLACLFFSLIFLSPLPFSPLLLLQKHTHARAHAHAQLLPLEGFAAAANILSSFPQDVLADLCHEVLDFLMYRVGSVDCDILQEKLAPAGVGIPTERAQGAINALTFTFRAAVQASVEAEELTTELKSFGASDDSSSQPLRCSLTREH